MSAANLRPYAFVCAVASALIAGPALAADIVLTPPDGGGVSITDSSGNTTRFRVDGDGSVFAPGLGSADQQSSRVCFDATSGQLGGCSTDSGTVTSVGVDAPITATGTATDPVIGITKAGTSTSGYLSSTDWNTFDNKGYVFLSSGINPGTTPWDASVSGIYNPSLTSSPDAPMPIDCTVRKLVLTLRCQQDCTNSDTITATIRKNATDTVSCEASSATNDTETVKGTCNYTDENWVSFASGDTISVHWVDTNQTPYVGYGLGIYCHPQ